MRWILSKEFTFEAAHQLPFHDGKCKRLHGHSWRGTVYVAGDKLCSDGAKQGMLMDYGDIKKAFNPIVEDYLDHHFLNETLGLKNPTSEEIARWLFNKLKKDLPVVGVLINETCTSSCFYSDHEFDFAGFAGVLG
jgi:6-pyruvoyltetrahydropterin/6-carboxytetrahydropterin synthase